MNNFFRRAFCSHTLVFVRNIHGDEIIEHGYKRSEWKCSLCGKRIFKDHVHDALEPRHSLIFMGEFDKQRAYQQENHKILVDQINSLIDELAMSKALNDKDVWYWQGEGDDLESMSDNMKVLIKADDLRKLVQLKNLHHRKPAAYRAKVEDMSFHAADKNALVDCLKTMGAVPDKVEPLYTEDEEWEVWWGIGEMRCLPRRFSSKEEAEKVASEVKSRTEVRMAVENT